MAWQLVCLLCEDWESADLVLTQEHAMSHHGVTREDIRDSMRCRVSPNYFAWRAPDGRLWMRAWKDEGAA